MKAAHLFRIISARLVLPNPNLFRHQTEGGSPPLEDDHDRCSQGREDQSETSPDAGPVQADGRQRAHLGDGATPVGT